MSATGIVGWTAHGDLIPSIERSREHGRILMEEAVALARRHDELTSEIHSIERDLLRRIPHLERYGETLDRAIQAVRGVLEFQRAAGAPPPDGGPRNE